jgi:hypothetical protein
MKQYPPGPSGSHTHPPPAPVADSQEVSEQLRPIVDELNRIIDRLEDLAGLDDQEIRPDGPRP